MAFSSMRPFDSRLSAADAALWTLNVTVKNDLGTLQATHKITIEAEEDPTQKVYLPYIDK